MLPTPRLLALLLVPGALLAAATLAPGLLLFAAAAWLLALGLTGAEWRLLAGGPAVSLRRRHEPRLSLGAENLIWLDLESRAPRALAVTLRDETPTTCLASAVFLRATLPPGGSV